jgi:hypothetical protein
MNFGKRIGTAVVTLCILTAGAGVIASRAKADEWNKKTILTVDQPIQVTDTYLDPGTYVFILADSSSDRQIVRIWDKDQQHLINTILAIPAYRLNPTSDARFTFWETPPGTARAIRQWYFAGDNWGTEFRYPKIPRQLVAFNTPAPAAPAPPPPAPEVAAVAAPEPPAPAVVPEAVPEQTAEQQPEPVVVAQNTPPPPPPAQEAAPAPAPAEELPKTATSYPLIGLGGLFSLALLGLVRFARSV